MTESTVEMTVCIPTYNGEKRLPEVLDRLRSQINTEQITWEIIVVDNNSSDQTAKIVQDYQAHWPQICPLRYIFEETQGAAFARLRAVKEAEGVIIGFLDDDTVPELNWVAAAYAFGQEHPQAGAYGSRIYGDYEVSPPKNFHRIAPFLAITDRGSKARCYEQKKRLLPPSAGLVVRRSNLRSFLKHQYLSSLYRDIPIWWINIQNSLAYVGCSAPVLVSKGCNKLLVPSSYTEDYKTSSGFRPEIDNKITWKNLKTEQDGYEYSRQEKIKLIKDICQTQKLDKPELRVCTHVANSKNLTNCCKCEKCLRTMIGVLVEGDNISNYGFNLSVTKTIERTKDKFNSSSMITKEDQLFFWQDIQRRAKEIIVEDDSCVIDGANLKPFLSWLISVDLRKLYITHQRVNRFRQLVKVLSSRFPIVFRVLYQLDKLFKSKFL